MRYLRRSLMGVVLLSLTAGLLAVAAASVWSALESAWSVETAEREAAERVFAANVIAVEPRRVVPVLETFGEVQSQRTLEIRAGAGGTVVELADAFEEGGAVAAGQTLVRIDPADATAALNVAQADRAEAEAGLRDAERSLALAGDDLASAERQGDLRQRALARQRDLAARGVGTEAAVETAELAAAAAEQGVLARRQALAAAEARLDQARIGLERQRIAVAEAERRLAETEIEAEFGGVLAEVSVVEGGLVTANEKLARLVDPEALEVAFRVSTAQYARLIDAQGRLRPAPVEVAIDVEGVDLMAEGRISRESAVVGEGQTGRLIFARLDGAGGFRPGDFVTVRVEEPPLEGVAMLPAAAVGSDGAVLVLGEGDRLERVAVEMLRRQGDEVIVRAAALAGREVVAERVPLLGAGIRVRPIRPAGQTAAQTVAQTAAGPEMLELSDERRARLVAFVEGNAFMPDDAKARMLAQLREPRVPAQMVARIEARIGG